MTALRQHRAKGWRSGVRHNPAGVAPRAVQWASRRVTRKGWVAVLLTVLLAFTWQSFVTQTHERFDRAAYSAATGVKAAGPHSQSGQSPANPADTCPICREIAQAGHYLLPASIVVHTPETIAHWDSSTSSLALTLHLRSHAWQSRAPPTPLQA